MDDIVEQLKRLTQTINDFGTQKELVIDSTVQVEILWLRDMEADIISKLTGKPKVKRQVLGANNGVQTGGGDGNGDEGEVGAGAGSVQPGEENQPPESKNHRMKRKSPVQSPGTPGGHDTKLARHSLDSPKSSKGAHEDTEGENRRSLESTASLSFSMEALALCDVDVSELSYKEVVKAVKVLSIPHKGSRARVVLQPLVIDAIAKMNMELEAEKKAEQDVHTALSGGDDSEVVMDDGENAHCDVEEQPEQSSNEVEVEVPPVDEQSEVSTSLSGGTDADEGGADADEGGADADEGGADTDEGDAEPSSMEIVENESGCNQDTTQSVSVEELRKRIEHKTAEERRQELVRRLERTNQLKLDREKKELQEKREAEERERKEQEEEERKAKDAEERERLVQETEERLKKEQKAAEEKACAEREALERAEQLKKEQVREAQVAKEMKERSERQRIESEKKKEAARLQREQEEARLQEERAKVEEEARVAAERKARAEAEAQAKVEEARAVAEAEAAKAAAEVEAAKAAAEAEAAKAAARVIDEEAQRMRAKAQKRVAEGCLQKKPETGEDSREQRFNQLITKYQKPSGEPGSDSHKEKSRLLLEKYEEERRQEELRRKNAQEAAREKAQAAADLKAKMRERQEKVKQESKAREEQARRAEQKDREDAERASRLTPSKKPPLVPTPGSVPKAQPGAGASASKPQPVPAASSKIVPPGSASRPLAVAGSPSKPMPRSHAGAGAGAITPVAPPRVPGESYDMSDHEGQGDSDDDDDSEEDYQNQKPRKPIPAWAEGAAFQEQLHIQFGRDAAPIDPDTIFEEVATVDIIEVFNVKKKYHAKYQGRSSSGNWVVDRVTSREDRDYKKKMGYYKDSSQ